jgi:epimerase transport system membrane fusion protein
MTPINPSLPPVRTDDRRLRLFGLGVLLSVFGGLGAWAALAPLSSAVLAPGLIAVESYRKTVQHLEGGIVKTIQVRDGELVAKDQILLTLDETQPRAQLEVLRGQYLNSRAREARLIALRDGRSAVQYPSDPIMQQDDARLQDAIRVQNQIFKARKQGLEGETALYRQQIDQLREKAKGLRAQKLSRDRLADSYRAEVADFNALLADGYTEKQKVRDFERNLAQSQGQSEELLTTVAATEFQISEVKLKIVQLQKDLQREVSVDLDEVQTELFDLREKIRSLNDTVRRTEIRAPQAGMVLGLTVHTLGAVIPAGARILDIVPQKETLIVEAKVSPLDIDRVRVGQAAEVRFSAFKTRSTPKIEGKTISISADRLVDEESKDNAPYYLARVEVTPAGMKTLASAQLELVPGMPAEVLITTGARTLLQYVIEPVKTTFSRSLIED